MELTPREALIVFSLKSFILPPPLLANYQMGLEMRGSETSLLAKSVHFAPRVTRERLPVHGLRLGWSPSATPPILSKGAEQQRLGGQLARPLQTPSSVLSGEWDWWRGKSHGSSSPPASGGGEVGPQPQ